MKATFGTGQPTKKQMTMAAATASDFARSTRLTRTRGRSIATWLGSAKFAAVSDGDNGSGDYQADQRDRRQRRSELTIGDAGEAADHHVLRVAGDGGGAADVGCHSDRQQIRNGIAAELGGDFQDQGREHQTHGVVDEEGREESRNGDDGGEQENRPVRVFHHPGADQPEESGEAQVGDDNHHAEQQHDRVVVDSAIGLVHCDDVKREHQAGADDGCAGAIDAETGQTADGENQVRGGKDDDGWHVRREYTPFIIESAPAYCMFTFALLAFLAADFNALVDRYFDMWFHYHPPRLPTPECTSTTRR